MASFENVDNEDSTKVRGVGSKSTPAPEHWLAYKHVVIAGAGMSGLSLALSLCKQWPSSEAGNSMAATSMPRITIFERDSQFNRLGGGREGYTLSLRTDDKRGGGVQVLDDLGLYEQVLKESVTVEGKKGGMVLWDKDWNELLVASEASMINGTKRGLSGIRVRRNALQKILADAVKELEDQTDFDVTIHWGKAVLGVERQEAGTGAKAILDDGNSVDCDIFIAADGSNSKIRNSLRPGDGLNFAKTICIAATAKFETASQIPGTLDRNWGAVLGWTGIGLFCAPVDEKSALWSLSYRSKKPRERLEHPLSEETIHSLLEEARILGRYAEPQLKQLIDATDPSTLMIINCWDRPSFKHDLPRDGPVLFIGDSNHALSPFSGNGANMAMIDSWDLAQCFLTKTSFEDAVRVYDESVAPRTNLALNQSHRFIDIAHATGWKATMYWMILKVFSFFYKGRSR